MITQLLALLHWNRIRGKPASFGISDAPSDGNTYGRLNAAWAIIAGAAHTQNTDQYLDFGGANQVAVAALKALVDAGSGGVVNMCLNPGFECQLYGTHTTAITRINAASTTRNLTLPGWQWVSGTGSPDATVTQDTATHNSRAACKVAIDAVGTSNPRLRQIWNATHWLEALVYDVRSKYLTFAVDVKLSAGTANACRAFIATDGTGGTTTYSSYKANDTNWERLLVSVQIPADATSVEFGLYFESDSPDYYVDNCMAAASAAALTALAWQPRLPVTIASQGDNFIDAVNQLQWTNATGTTIATGDGGADTDYSVQANRPHWANRCECSINIYSAGATDYGGVKPSGATWLYLVGYLKNIAHGSVPIGADGQLQIYRSATADDLYVNFKNWVGEGL